MSELRLSWVPYRLRLREPLVTARGTVRERSGLLLRLEDAEGTVGYGDVAVWPGRERVELAEAQGWLAAVREAVVGAGAAALTTYPARSAGERAARAALETAFLDWQARGAGRPLAQWLRADAASSVPVNALLSAAEPPATVAAARSAVAAGYRTLKLKVALRADEVERVAAVRAAIGNQVRLRLDANGVADLETALAFARAVAPLGVQYLEQPVATLEELAALRRRAPVPVAADEVLTGPEAVERALRLEAADVLVLKLPVLGGFGAVLAAAERAQARGVEVVVTSALESGVGLAAAVHAAAAVDGGRAHGLATAQLVEPLGTVEPLFPVDGMLAVPTGSGLGVTVQLGEGEDTA